MVFKVEKDKETGKFKLYNKEKKTYSKRMFKTKESASKMATHYGEFGSKAREAKKAKKEV